MGGQRTGEKSSLRFRLASCVVLPVRYTGGRKEHGDDDMKYRKARTLQDVKNDPRVEEVWSEDPDQKDYWAGLAPGWVKEVSDPVHCLHEYTVKELCDALNNVDPCECEECISRTQKVLSDSD